MSKVRFITQIKPKSWGFWKSILFLLRPSSAFYTVFPEIFCWKLRVLSQKVTKVTSKKGQNNGKTQRVYRGEGFSALFTFCPNCPAIISPRILGKIGAVVGVPRACQKFWGFFCLVVCSSLPDGWGRLMEGPTWQTQNVNKAEKHTPK